MPAIRSDTDAMPRGLHDDDPTMSMGFSILVTVCSLIGLLFCFRRASRLLPRNLNIQLQMFGQNNRNAQGRGPIALSEDDLAGATGMDWDDIEAQLQEEEEEERSRGEGVDDVTRPLKPMTRKVGYLDEDEEEEEEGQELSSVSFRGRYRDEDEEEEEDANEDEFHDFVESAGPKAPEAPERRETQRETQRDTLFSLGGADGEQEV